MKKIMLAIAIMFMGTIVTSCTMSEDSIVEQNEQSIQATQGEQSISETDPDDDE